MGPRARWNAGTPVWRVNIFRNAPETADIPGSTADQPGVEYSAVDVAEGL
jgi:hypothetical protein